MNLQKIYYFIKIVEAMSLKQAADELFVSRQALSKQIQQLEDELGACLLERSTNRVVVTEIGKKLYDLYKPIVLEVTQARNEMERFLQYKKNYMKIAYFSIMPYDSLIQPLVELWQNEYPENRVNLIAAEAGLDRELIQNDSVDLLITNIIQADEWDGMEIMPLCKKKMKIMVSDKHDWYGKEQVTVDDIARENMLVFGDRPIFLERSFMPEVKAKERVVVYNTGSYMANLRLGNAFGIVDGLYQYIEDDKYRLIDLPEEIQGDAQIALVYKPFHPLVDRIRRIGGLFREQLGQKK